MPDVIVFKEGGYRYIRAGFQFSSGVAAEAGFEIERARLARPLPLGAGFAAVEAHLGALGRPSTAFAACELRSAEPFTEQGFEDFNRGYVKTLARWGIFRNEVNPVARTNVCPQYDQPREPVLYAFSYTVPAHSRRGSFIVAGGAEVRGGPEGYAARTVRYGDTSADALREKLRFVVELMGERLKALGFSWQDALRRRPIPCTTSARLSAPRSPRAVRRRVALRGTSRGRRWWGSSSRWMCAARRARSS